MSTQREYKSGGDLAPVENMKFAIEPYQRRNYSRLIEKDAKRTKV